MTRPEFKKLRKKYWFITDSYFIWLIRNRKYGTTVLNMGDK
jgi:hypothetical protein